MQGRIQLEGMKFFAFHGYYPQEQEMGNNFIVDVEIDFLVDRNALLNDQLDGTINYEIIYEIVKKEMNISSKLLENVAFRIKMAIQNTFPQIQNSRIRVSKLSPPIKGDIMGVSVAL